MREKFTLTIIFSLWLGLIFSEAPAVVSQKPADAVKSGESKSSLPAAKFALLVGINDYTDKDIPDLGGCENDVRLMREALSELYGFKTGADTKE